MTTLGAVLLLFVSIVPDLRAEEHAPEPEKRPKVGLVLSGGGARGLAHMGVLEWFEQHRIPVDYLAGTSMGGLIGGMYATGMSPDEMRVFIKAINWNKVFGTGIDHQELSYRRKEDRNFYQVDLEFGLRHGIRTPPGLSSGHQVGLLIDNLTLAYATLKNFDELPIPFRCVAADIIAAKPVVMKDGLLSTAMRATMSIPGLFPPVQRNGQWLVDGGILDNVPTDVMRDFHPDVIIAVDVGTPLGDENAVNSIFGVLSQTVGVFTAGSYRRNLADADIVITPNLKDHAITDFNNVDTTADLGIPAAEEKANVLERYSLDEASWQKYLVQRTAHTKRQLPVPEDLHVTGVSARAANEIRRELRAYIGAPLVKAHIEEDLTRLAGEGRYESLDYGFIIDASGRNVLQIRVREKTYAPPTIDFSIGLVGSDINEINFAFGTRLTLFDIGGYGSEWRHDFNLGNGSSFATEYYHPLGHTHLFFAPRAFYLRDKENYFEGGIRRAVFQVNNYGLGFDVGVDTWQSELRVGYQINRLDAGLSTGEAPIDKISGKVHFAKIRWAFDGTNSATVPTKGIRLTAEGRWYFNAPLMTAPFAQADFKGIMFKPVSRRDSIFVFSGVGTTFDKEAAPAQKFSVGGPFWLGAYDSFEYIGNHYVLMSTGYMRRIYQLPPLAGGGIYVLAWYDLGGAFDDFSKADYHSAGSVGFIIDTRLGPFGLVGSLGGHGKGRIYFTLGRFF